LAGTTHPSVSRVPLLHDFFVRHPNLLNYFAQFGCTNIFQGYIPDAYLGGASALFIQQFGVTDHLTHSLIINFTFHAFFFVAALREQLTERADIVRAIEYNVPACHIAFIKVWRAGFACSESDAC
jgi:hypothetical protein